MDKSQLRRMIREKKQAMTLEQIETASRDLAKQLFATEQYRNAKTLYGYLPYNQEVRTVPVLEQVFAFLMITVRPQRNCKTVVCV